ncbi:GNAT family N-acetyltransferase [Methylocystis heyeri]|uniref:GNAT family N-acetyltransferase n=1 Tax=Methylocystis heyeri TaxID=391905 RepID=A0A6B8KBL9_9HYPH|nr:GNAT family N-acetyltransferase [Methylocystis heyeri]QGM45067.1 GNAT family N-acetyltransferase [Methylocystis heyeri]
MPAGFSIRRLNAADAGAFKEARQEMFRSQPREFRFAPEDESGLPLEEFARRLGNDYVVAAFGTGGLVGLGGFSCFSGAKVGHKGLIWGMYVKPEARGAGAADAIMRALLDHAAGTVEQVVLTAVASNPRAIRFYERWGFRAYGCEPRSVKLADGDYLDETLMALSFSK